MVKRYTEVTFWR